MDGAAEELLRVEEALWILTAPTGKALYDFPFDRHLACRRPLEPPSPISAVARVGAPPHYPALHDRWLDAGVVLIHSPAQHRRAAELRGWYPLLEDLTPRTLWFTEPPHAEFVGARLGWPIVIRGAHQTRHDETRLGVLDGPEAYQRALQAYGRDPALHWQNLICRSHVPLRPSEDSDFDRIPGASEFRTFWWRGQLAGFGRCFWEGSQFPPSEAERREVITLAGEAARRLDVPFLVVDVAQAADGRWLVIDCNDGQASGYGGVPPLGLWQRIVELEKSARG